MRARTIASVIVLAIAWVSVVTVGADEVDEQADYVAAVEQAKGHLLASRQVYRRGQRVRADVHASHPIQELGYRLWRPVTKVDQDLGARLQAALKDPGRAGDARAPSSDYDKIVERTVALLDRAVARTVPAARRDDPRFQARVIQALLVAIDEEYTEAIAERRVVLEIEYQDAWGFFQRLRERWSALRKSLARSRPDTVAVIDEQMTVLAGAFPGIETPVTPAEVEHVARALTTIATALAAVGDRREKAR